MVFTQDDFERDFLGELRACGRQSFRYRADREELILDTISQGWELLQTAPPTATPKSIAYYAVKRVKAGRQFKQSSRSLLGPNPHQRAKAQRHEFTIQQTERMGEDPALLAALRVDFPQWVLDLTDRQQMILLAVLRGDSTGDIARRLKISLAAVSQTRRKLIKRWHEYHS